MERIKQSGADSSQVPRVPSYLCKTFRKGFSFWYLTLIIWPRWGWWPSQSLARSKSSCLQNPESLEMQRARGWVHSSLAGRCLCDHTEREQVASWAHEYKGPRKSWMWNTRAPSLCHISTIVIEQMFKWRSFPWILSFFSPPLLFVYNGLRENRRDLKLK